MYIVVKAKPCFSTPKEASKCWKDWMVSTTNADFRAAFTLIFLYCYS